MALVLPSFDDMAEMARTRPDEFERLRTHLCETLINEAPKAFRPRLRGLQFRIDMERRRAKTPLASCIRISAMMHDSLEQLRLALNGELEQDGAGVAPAGRTVAPVVSLETWRRAREARPG